MFNNTLNLPFVLHVQYSRKMLLKANTKKNVPDNYFDKHDKRNWINNMINKVQKLKNSFSYLSAPGRDFTSIKVHVF